MALCIGIDLDNTLICYDHAFLVAAKERKLIPEGFTGTKQQVRDTIRMSPGVDGEMLWQQLQGHVYGTGIVHAQLFAGVLTFLVHAAAQDATVYIVSHKTEFGHFDPNSVNLREAARAFLEAQGVFDHLPQEHLFFCTTRLEKLHKIAALKCDVFVDDLEEVFGETTFPRGVRKLLFTLSPPDKLHGLEVCGTWPQIERSIFDASRNAS